MTSPRSASRAAQPTGYAELRAYESPHGIEQSRRDFMRDYPDLYRYIAHREAEKALDSAGDQISGHHAAANRVWSLAAIERERWRVMANV